MAYSRFCTGPRFSGAARRWAGRRTAPSWAGPGLGKIAVIFLQSAAVNFVQNPTVIFLQECGREF